MCTFIVNSRKHQDQFAADQVAVRKEAERQAKRKLTENNRRRLLYKKTRVCLLHDCACSPAAARGIG